MVSSSAPLWFANNALLVQPWKDLRWTKHKPDTSVRDTRRYGSNRRWLAGYARESRSNLFYVLPLAIPGMSRDQSSHWVTKPTHRHSMVMLVMVECRHRTGDTQ